jgi:DNA-binding SARP family transcriptional activator
MDAHRRSVPIASKRAQALLVYLALRIDAGGASSAEIASLLGGDPGTALRELQHALQGLSPDLLIADDDVVRLDHELVSVDVERFAELALLPSVNSAREAADLYRGNLLEGYRSGSDALDEWIGGRRKHYVQMAVAVLGRLLSAQIKAGWWEAAVDTASRLLSLDPSQEIVHRTLMRVQLEQGRPDSALRRYQECADVLRRQFGRVPSPETERVHAEIRTALAKSPAPREVLRARGDRPILIMLVEDDAVSSALVEGFLTEAGYEVVAVPDSSDALIEIGRRRFDLLILDVNLPTLSGLQLFEVMMRKGIETPAMFITGAAGTEAEALSLEMGAADFLRKPIRKETLLPRIRTVLQHRRRGAETTTK